MSAGGLPLCRLAVDASGESSGPSVPTQVAHCVPRGSHAQSPRSYPDTCHRGPLSRVRLGVLQWKPHASPRITICEDMLWRKSMNHLSEAACSRLVRLRGGEARTVEARRTCSSRRSIKEVRLERFPTTDDPSKGARGQKSGPPAETPQGNWGVRRCCHPPLRCYGKRTIDFSPLRGAAPKRDPRCLTQTVAFAKWHSAAPAEHLRRCAPQTSSFWLGTNSCIASKRDWCAHTLTFHHRADVQIGWSYPSKQRRRKRVTVGARCHSMRQEACRLAPSSTHLPPRPPTANP